MTRDPKQEDEAHRTVAVLTAYLAMLDSGWDEMDDEDRRKGIRLALEASRRAGRSLRNEGDGR